MPWRCLCCFRLKGRKIPAVYAVQELLEQLIVLGTQGGVGKNNLIYKHDHGKVIRLKTMPAAEAISPATAWGIKCLSFCTLEISARVMPIMPKGN